MCCLPQLTSLVPPKIFIVLPIHKLLRALTPNLRKMTSSLFQSLIPVQNLWVKCSFFLSGPHVALHSTDLQLSALNKGTNIQGRKELRYLHIPCSSQCKDLTYMIFKLSILSCSSWYLGLCLVPSSYLTGYCQFKAFI